MHVWVYRKRYTWLENEESKAQLPQHCQQLNIIFSFFPWKKKIKKNDNMHKCMHACRLFSFMNDL